MPNDGFRLQDLIPLKARRYLVDRALLGTHYLCSPLLTRLGTSSSAFFRRAVVDVCQEVYYYLESHDRDRISDERLASLLAVPHDYADPKLDEAVPLSQRISGQVLPFLEPILQEPGIRRVMEIGFANGSVLSYLASRYPHVQFVGVDFHVAPEIQALARANLILLNGYALDLLEDGSRLPTPIDVVFTQFTAQNFLPKEILRYIAAFRRLDIRYLVFNEPTRAGFPIRLHARNPRSIFLGGRTWKHDYPGLVRRAGYDVTAFQCKHWSGLIEPRFNRVRFDTHLMQMVARSARSR